MSDDQLPQRVVELNGVSVRYGPTPVLADVDLTIEPGERVILVGASGAGKTTLLALLAGLLPSAAIVEGPASVRVLGNDLSQLRGRRLRRHRASVGVVRQQLDLALPLRVIHNVNAGRLGRWSTAAALWSLVRPAGRTEAASVLDQVGLADRLLDRTDSLSGGERQRVAIARVLRQHPLLVLADEPTSSVDPRLSDEMAGLLCKPAAPWTTVMSLHEPDLARRHATRLIGLRQGRIVFDTTPDAISDADLTELYEAAQRSDQTTVDR